VRIIILHHGLFGYNRLQLGPVRVRYWDGIPRAIAEAGYPVVVTQVHPTAGIVRRADQLKAQILDHLEQLGGSNAKAVIIAHSMGGLDARYMIRHLGMVDRVEALLTISTPHRGSAYYDHLIARAGPLGRMDSVRQGVIDLEGCWDVTMARARVFNELVSNVPSVKYYCVTASCSPERVPIFLHRAYAHILEAQGPNDGLVAVESARWGTELGHWPFHHLHLVNWRLRLISPPSEEDVRPRYLQLLSLLRADGVLDAPVSPPHPALTSVAHT
jgi:triacylglycerol lipase